MNQKKSAPSSSTALRLQAVPQAPLDSEEDYYQILGVSPSATIREITLAYLLIEKKYI